MTAWVGIDIGTTNIKAIAINENGHLLAQSSGACMTYHPRPNQVEQNPDEIYRLFVEVLRQIVQQLQPLSVSIEAISLCSAMHSVIPLDAQNRRLARAWLWADNRSQAQADTLKNTSYFPKIYAQTGIPAHPYAPSTKMQWCREQQPKVFAKTARFVSQKEFIWYRLFGQFEIDFSMASGTGLLHHQKRRWSAAALELAGVSEDYLSEIVPTYHIQKLTNQRLCTYLGLPQGTPFVIGGGDACLANLGSGALEKGITTLTIGTSGAVRQTTTTPTKDQRLFTYILDDEYYVSGGPTNNGGNVLEWLSKHLLLKDTAELLAIAEKAPAGAKGLIFVPYLLGERAPFWNAQLTARYLNLTWQHQQSDLIRATIEGVLLHLNQIRNLLEQQIAPTQIIHANGGFAQSKFWVQLLADIFGVNVRVNESNESSCLGAILLAMKSLGYISSLQEGVQKYVSYTDTYQPNPATKSLYRKLNGDFQRVLL
ncbi:MAG: gluconokinase [Runella sp.]